LDISKTIIVYCKSGGRSSTASETLAQHDFSVYNMLGGINAWKEKFATLTAAPMPIQTPTETPLPSVSPALTPEEEKRVPGFEVTFALAAISLIVWCLLKKRNIF
jgi:3-mercaptopyruvate sulfurtransferase SseA